jgi:CRP-like cAMP-binding protein
MMRKIEAGDAIYRQDNRDRRTFVIEQGLVKQTVVNLEGDEVILWVYGPGAVLGLPSERCTLTALQDTVVRRVDLLPRDLLCLTEARLRNSEFRLMMISTNLVSVRLAQTLLQLTREINCSSVPMLKEELAQMTATTLFTISRILSKWQRDGIVLSGRGEVVVLDRERLAKERFAVPSSKEVAA